MVNPQIVALLQALNTQPVQGQMNTQPYSNVAQVAMSTGNQQQQAKGSPVLRAIMMLLQGADSVNTANFLKKPGTYETDPLMKPFAQAGNPIPMMGAYGLEDKGIASLPSAGKQNNAALLQILLNLAGIARTQDARKTGH